MFRKLFSGTRYAGIPEPVWARCLASMPFLERLSGPQRDLLLEHSQRFAATKRFSGAAGFEVDDEVRATVSLQACLPVLALGIEAYRDFVEIIVYPDRFLAPRQRVDDAGVVHEGIEELAGEAMDGGPVVLSWPDLQLEPGAVGSVVIHEFVHKLDMLDGEADGFPPLSAADRRRWSAALEAAYEQFCEQLDEVERTIPIDIDPESEAADEYYATLPLDPYAATDLAEFFAVSGEAFFTDPDGFDADFADLSECYRRFFRLDLRRRAAD